MFKKMKSGRLSTCGVENQTRPQPQKNSFTEGKDEAWATDSQLPRILYGSERNLEDNASWTLTWKYSLVTEKNKNEKGCVKIIPSSTPGQPHCSCAASFTCSLKGEFLTTELHVIGNKGERLELF